MANRRAKSGLTLVELLAVIAIIGLLAGLLMPAVQAAREAARRAACSNNLRQVATGVLGFEAAFGKFPALAYEWNLHDMLANEGKLGTHDWERVGPLFHILPFMEESAIYDESIKDWLNSTPVNPGHTPMLAVAAGRQPKSFLCPSDPVRAPWTFGNAARGVGLTSYHACQGDTFGGFNADPRWPNRGVFRWGKIGPLTGVPEQKRITTMAHVRDGASNTAMLGEVAIMDGTGRLPGGVGLLLNGANLAQGTTSSTPAECLALMNGGGSYSTFQTNISGGQPGWRWHDGWERAVTFSTISAPNTPRCGGGGVQIVPASSHHMAGAFVSMCDGSIRWVGDDIDDGYPAGLVYGINHKGPSNFGVWGAYGSMAGGDLTNHVW